MGELALERQVAPQTPRVMAGALVIPAALLVSLIPPPAGEEEQQAPDLAATADAEAKRRTELAAMAAVMAWEHAHGFEPEDVSARNLGYDIESRDPATGRLRFVEVKGRLVGAESVTLTRNECMTALNSRDDYWLAVALVGEDGQVAGEPLYRQDPVARALIAEPRFGLVSVQLAIG